MAETPSISSPKRLRLFTLLVAISSSPSSPTARSERTRQARCRSECLLTDIEGCKLRAANGPQWRLVFEEKDSRARRIRVDQIAGHQEAAVGVHAHWRQYVSSPRSSRTRFGITRSPRMRLARASTSGQSTCAFCRRDTWAVDPVSSATISRKSRSRCFVGSALARFRKTGQTEANGRKDRQLMEAGGERGIRTLGRVSPTHAFQACSFNHSDISPCRINDLRTRENQNSGIVVSPPVCRDRLRTFLV